MTNERMRKDFEIAFMPDSKDRYYWMRKSQGGEYRNPSTQSAWRGFKLGYSAALRAPVERQALQAEGKHPAPCARLCEATAFNVEIRSLKAQLAKAVERQAPDGLRQAVYMALHYYMNVQNPNEWEATDKAIEAVRSYFAAAPSAPGRED